jgi:hypothetical protein
LFDGADRGGGYLWNGLFVIGGKIVLRGGLLADY